MNRSLNFFFWTVWSSEALAAGESASTPDPRGPDCVARAWRRLRSFGVAERSKRKSRDGGAAARRSVERPAHAPSWAGRPAKVRKHRVSGRGEVPEGGGTPSDPPTRGTRVGAWRGVDPPACAAGRLPPRMSGAVPALVDAPRNFRGVVVHGHGAAGRVVLVHSRHIHAVE